MSKLKWPTVSHQYLFNEVRPYTQSKIGGKKTVYSEYDYRSIGRPIPVFAGIYNCSEHRDTNNTETYKTNFIRDIQVLRVASRELRYYFNVFFPCDELKHHKSLSKTNVYYMVVSYTLYYVYIYIYTIQ